MSDPGSFRQELDPISPTTLGSFVKLERCEQYLGWDLLADDLVGDDARFDEALLSPLYAETGTQFEVEQLRSLLVQRRIDTVAGPAGRSVEEIEFDETWGEERDNDDDNPAWQDGLDDLTGWVKQVANTTDDYVVVGFQPPLAGRIGVWNVAGLADIIVIRPQRSDEEFGPVDAVVDVLEVKSTSDERTHHRIQAACYSRLIRSRLAADDDFDGVVAFQGRVVTRKNAIADIGYTNLEGFDLDPIETDIELMLKPGGRLDRALFDVEGEDDLDDVEPVRAWEMTNRMSRRCAGCEYHDVCYTRAVEEDGLELLGLPEGTQDDLAEEAGIETLSNLGDLFDYDYFLSPSNRTNEQVRAVDNATVERVRNEVELKDLPRYSIAADVFSREGDPEERPAKRQWIPDSGYNLPQGEPEDGPLPDWLIDYPDRSLIRVYLYVQEDGIRDRLNLLGGYVINYETGEDRHVSALTESLPYALGDEDEVDEQKDEVEQNLIERFLRGTDERLGLVDAIRAVAPDPSYLDDYGDQFDHPGFVHLYFYSPSQRDALMEAAKRHFGAGEGGFEALRTLLGLRTEIEQQDIDQEMVSVLQEEFVTRHLLRFLGFGIVQTVEQFERPDPDSGRPPELTYRTRGSTTFDWEHPVEDETVEIPLQHIFDELLFENAVSYAAQERVQFDLDTEIELPDIGTSYENQFPFAHRHTDGIPLEYVWAVFDELTPDWVDPEAFDDPAKVDRLREQIHRVRHVNGEGSRDIEGRHLRALAEKLAEAVEHIEASISEWEKNSTVPKTPLPLDRLLSQEFDQTQLALTAREYLDLEHGAKRRQLTRDWRQSVPYRLTGGSSVMFRCTNPPDPNDETNQVEGELWAPDGVDLEATTSEDSISEGDWVLMTPVNIDVDPPEELGINRAGDLARMPLVHVSRVEDGEIAVDAPWNDWDHWPRGYHSFLNDHHRYVPREMANHGTARYIEPDADDEPNQVVIDEGAAFILDPPLDDITAYHCSRALERATDNHVLHWLNDLLVGHRDSMETPYVDGDLIEGDPDGSFVETEFVEAESIDEYPNDLQRRFIREDDRHLVVVQGPPGTGKTQYTMAPAVLGRAYAFAQENRDFAAGVSALSHDAVDELFDAIRTVVADRQREGLFENLKLVRVRPSTLPDDAVPYEDREDDQIVEHIAYHDDDGEDRLQTLCEEYLLTSSDEHPQQFLLFGPPTSIRGAINSIAADIVDPDDLDRDTDEHPPTAWDVLEQGESDIFDLIVVDEASMMDLPLLFLVGAFLSQDGQVLLAGDHRQMQPIQSYSWEEEDRETIEQTIPFLSALDYIRFLKGDIEEIEFIERDSPALDEEYSNDEQELATLPIYPLEQSYRLPQPIADLLTELFYSEDDIDLEGIDRDPVPEGDIDHPAIAELARSDEWLSVFIHSGERDERTSEIEAAVTEAVFNGFDIVDPDDEDLEAGEISAGAVIPFTDQRSRLQRTLDEDIQTQTVEKFQGGERDLIVMSMVASDPGYVNQISEFLLSPYRFNVAASRMKRKLIVIAAESVFQTSHPNADRYEDQLAWKRLYDLTGALDPDITPDASGHVTDIDPEIEEDTYFEVYHADLDGVGGGE